MWVAKVLQVFIAKKYYKLFNLLVKLDFVHFAAVISSNY